MFLNARPGVQLRFFGGYAVWVRRQPITRWFLVLAGSALSLCATQLWGRFRVPTYMVDVRALAEKAPIVFRGQVVDVDSAGENPPESIQLKEIATFQVDRVYRGHVRAETALHFTYDPSPFSNGHDCINFQPNTYWVVFAQGDGGRLELSDDCNGAFRVSPLLGPTLENEGWMYQMEADFMAGLKDSDPQSRLMSIQRLGGLGLPPSRDALHRVMETGDKEESTWAIYAALRTGDVTVLAKVKQLLQVGENAAPERAIALQLRNVADENALSDLIAILRSAPAR